MRCGKCSFWYCGVCHNTNIEKDALDESCASYVHFNRYIYVTIKDEVTKFTKIILKEQEVKI